MSPPASPLKARSVNTSSPTKKHSSSSSSKPETAPKAHAEDTIEKQKPQPKSMEYHRQILQSRLEEDKDTHKYVSPSDMIMSPATQKLEALKGKRFGNVGKKGKMGQGLFVGSLWKDGGEKEKGLGKEGEEGEAEKKE